MPANAHILFKILVQIATFDLVPTESVNAEMQSSLGIEDDDFVLTESFVDFEYLSSGPIRNLQILFLALLLLLMLPIVLLLLKVLFFWSSKMQKCVSYILNKLCFNVYIRFGLEAYLELSICSMIRFKNFTFETASDKFHSTFATMIFIGLIAFLAFAILFLQVRFSLLAT